MDRSQKEKKRKKEYGRVYTSLSFFRTQMKRILEAASADNTD